MIYRFSRRFFTSFLVATLMAYHPGAEHYPSPFPIDAAIPARLLFLPLRNPCTAKAHLFHEIKAWWLGDKPLAPLRSAYQRPLAFSFLFTAFDAFILLGVPFVGQGFFETAAHGAGISDAYGNMLYTTILLIGIEGLNPLRVYAQYVLGKITRSYIADVRHFLFDRAHQRAAEPLTVVQANLIYLHAPAFAIRNIDIPFKTPLLVMQGIINGWLLWKMDPLVAGVAVLTALGLSLWSMRHCGPLTEANTALRQAESETVAAFEKLVLLESSEAARTVHGHFQNVRDHEIHQIGQGLWYSGVVDQISTMVLMKGVMLWSGWHQFLTGRSSTAEILTILALSWNVQYRITGIFALVKSRLEAESASFLLVSLTREAA
jgi:hypothetical protein